ncbi:hypothetical protein, partial [Aestuariicoccus sp. MJ-SS9]|uniref:hypothetical protein n=1 Tax=Aestuariicoccus sp. MJ-SS9 TaxID=3079855 RepID=UPI00290DAF1E
CSYNASNGMDSRSESFADRLLQQRPYVRLSDEPDPRFKRAFVRVADKTAVARFALPNAGDD